MRHTAMTINDEPAIHPIFLSRLAHERLRWGGGGRHG
jgi:hypothetical protein